MHPIYTAEDWKRISPVFASRRLAVSTVEIATAILVDGQRPQDVANDRGMSKQTVHAAVKRVRAILDEHGASELVPVMVWLPPELAAQVMEMAKPYMDTKPAPKKAGKDA